MDTDKREQVPESIITFSFNMKKPRKILRHFKATKWVNNAGSGGSSEEIPLLCLGESEWRGGKPIFCSWQTSLGESLKWVGAGVTFPLLKFSRASAGRTIIHCQYIQRYDWKQARDSPSQRSTGKQERDVCKSLTDENVKQAFTSQDVCAVASGEHEEWKSSQAAAPWRPGRHCVTRGRRSALGDSSYLWSPLVWGGGDDGETQR